MTPSSPTMAIQQVAASTASANTPPTTSRASISVPSFGTTHDQDQYIVTRDLMLVARESLTVRITPDFMGTASADLGLGDSTGGG